MQTFLDYVNYFSTLRNTHLVFLSFHNDHSKTGARNNACDNPVTSALLFLSIRCIYFKSTGVPLVCGRHVLELLGDAGNRDGTGPCVYIVFPIHIDDIVQFIN